MKGLIEFIELSSFTRKWQKLGLSSDSLLRLQIELLENPTKGAVIKNSGGIRKIRIAIPGNRGRRSGGRVIYLYLQVRNEIYLMSIYTKTEMEDLTADQLRDLRKISELIKRRELQ